MYLDHDDSGDNIVGEHGYVWIYSYSPVVYCAGMKRRQAETLKKLGIKLKSAWAIEGKDYIHPDDEYIFEFTDADRRAVFNVLGIKNY